MYSTRKVKAVTIISLLSVVTGIFVIIGWVFHIQAFTNIVPEYTSMKFNAALCFVFLASALLITQFQLKKYSKVVFLGLSFIIILIGTLSLSEYLFHFNAGIDQLFMADNASIAKKYPFPGRMAASTALCFTLLGIAFSGFNIRGRFVRVLSQYLLHVVTAISAISIIGYLYGLSLFYDLYFAGAMALHTAILLFFLSIITSMLHPSLGLTNLFTGNLVGNVMARRLFTLLIFAVIILGVFSVQSKRYGLFSLEAGISLLAFCFLWVGLGLVWHTANWLNRIDIKRYEAEEEIKVMNEELENRVEERTVKLLDLLEKFKENESKFKAAFEKSAIGMALVSIKGKWLKVNKRLCDMIGYKEHELLTMSFKDITHPDDCSAHTDIMDRALKNENEAFRVEKRYVCKNGTILWVSINIASVIDYKGGPIYFVSQFEDITERKKAEQNLKTAYKQIKNHINSIKDTAWKQSHLMRSPLANLKGLTALLQDDPSDGKTLKHINAELERLDKAIIEMAEEATTQCAVNIVAKQRFFKSPQQAVNI